jgi:phospholipase C
MPRPTYSAAIAAGAVAIAACTSASRNPNVGTSVDPTAQLRNDIKNIVVIYAENRSFDNLFGKFPNANGISAVLINGRPDCLREAEGPQRIDGASSAAADLGQRDPNGVTPVVTQAQRRPQSTVRDRDRVQDVGGRDYDINGLIRAPVLRESNATNGGITIRSPWRMP